MARKRKKKSSGGARKRRNPSVKKMHHRRRRPNPGMLGSPTEWLTGGAGVLAGVVGTRAIPQAILGSKNSGPLGYAANAIAAAGLGWLSHMFMPRSKTLTAAVVAGGFAALIARMISDYTSFGSYLALSGVGDYMVSNFVSPQRILDPTNALWQVPAGWGGSPAPMLAPGPSLGVDLGGRAGAC